MAYQSTLTDSQDKLLSILPCFTSFLSCLGSAQIIYMVLTGRRTTPYRRILLGLSSADFLCSLSYPLQAFLLPRNTSSRLFAVGNDTSCSFLGFMQQSIFASILYNSMLSVYFLLTVRIGLSNQVVGNSYEPWMHALAIGYPLLTAIIGGSMNMFHELELGHGCWVNNYPEGCDCSKGECCREQVVSFFFGGLPAIVALALIAGNNLLVYLHVRTTIQRSIQRFRSNLTPPGTSNPSVELDNSNTTKRSSIFKSVKRLWNQPSQLGAQRHVDPQVQRVRAVAIQAFSYVGAFLVTYLFAAIVRVLAATGMGPQDEGKLFPLLVLQSLFLPSQGFFNVLVYLRPSFWRARTEYPHETMLWALRRALYGDKVQPQSRESVARPQPSSSDFGGLFVHRHEPARGASVLEQYGLANLYPENYWSSDDENNGGDHQIRQKSGAVKKDYTCRGPAEQLSKCTKDKVIPVEEEVAAVVEDNVQ